MDTALPSGEALAPIPAPLGFALTVVEGGAVLALEAPLASEVGTALALALEVPDLRFPFDLSGGVARFRHRRCRLRELVFRLEASKLGAWLAKLPLGDFGIFEPAVSFDEQGLTFSARAAVGGHSAEFTIRGAMLVGPGSALGFTLDDVRVYGFLPVPGPLLVEALYRALGRAVPWLRSDPALLEPMGATAVRLDALAALLVGVLPARGWRVPGRRGIRLTACEAAGGDLLLRFSRPDREAEASEPPDRGPQAGLPAWGGDRGPQAGLPARGGDPWLAPRATWEKYAMAEASLASGDLAGARALYRRALTRAPNLFAIGRLVQLMLARAEGLGEIGDVVARAWKQVPDWEPGRLALALAAEAGGRFSEAAEAFAKLAESAAASGAVADEMGARIAAARCWGRAGEGERAIETLLGALGRAPEHAGALRALREHLHVLGRWDQLLSFLRQRSAEAFSPQTRAALLADTGTMLLERSDDQERARQCFEQAVRLDPDQARAWEGLGRLELAAGQPGRAAEAFERARRLCAAAGLPQAEARAELWLGKLAEASGDLDGALGRFIRAMDLDGQSSTASLCAGEVAGRLGRFEEAKAALEQALARTSEVEGRLEALRRLAAIERDGHGDAVAARLLYERALADQPDHLETIEDLERLLAAAGQLEDLTWPLRRARARAGDPAAQARLAQLFCRVARQSGDKALLEEGLWWSAELRGEEGRAAALELAALVEPDGDEKRQTRLAEMLEAFIEGDEPEPDALGGALACRLAAVRARLGDLAGAENLVQQALAGPLEGAGAKEAWDLLARLALLRDDPAAAAAAQVAGAEDSRVSDEPVARAARLVAAALLTDGPLRDPEQAIPLFERALALDPHSVPAHVGMVDALVRLGRWPAAAELLEAVRGLSQPSDPRVLARLAEVQALGLDRGGEAEALLQELEPGASDPRIRLAIARITWKLGRLEESARHFQALVAAAPSGAASMSVSAEVPASMASEARLRLAQWFRLVGETAEARRTLTKALQPEPEEGAPSEVLVEVLESFDRASDLVTLLERRREIWAGTAEARRLARVLGQVLERQGRAEEAVALYAEVLAANPADVPILTQMAEIHRRESRSGPLADVLAQLFERALGDSQTDGSPDPDLDVEALGLELAAVLAEIDPDNGRAEGVLRRLLAERPACGDALELLGDLRWQAGDRTEADGLLIARVRLGDDAPHIARLVARRALEHLGAGGADESAVTLLGLLEEGDKSPDVVFTRAELAARGGQPEVAFTGFARAVAAARAAGDLDLGARAQQRLAELARTGAVPEGDAVPVLEEILEREPRAQVVADVLFELLEAEPDEATRRESFRRLLERAAVLDDAVRSRIHQAFAHAAEADADYVAAERAFGVALGSAHDPHLRAAQLLGRARVRIRCGDFDGAVADLDEAAALSPDSTATAQLRAQLEEQRPRGD